MQTYISNLVSSQVQMPFDKSLYEKLLKKFSGTAADYKNQFNCEKAPFIFAQMQLFELLKRYYQLAAEPKRLNFLTKQLIEPNKQELHQIEFNFWQEAPDYIASFSICSNCNKLKTTDVCEICFFDEKKFGSSYSDVSRTNFGTKYSYFRRQHFFECLIQFQGKQPATIEHELLSKLELLYKNNHQANLTKFNIMQWLKDLNAPHHYENIHLIYSLLTKIPCPNFEHIENELLDDFDKFLCEYNKVVEIKPFRKNFINVQYVLFLILNRREFTYKQEDFILPRTLAIRKNYEVICNIIFKQLGWNFVSICLN